MLEMDKTADARRKAQRNGEEDPIVIAQRFLNIFRQIHIFTPERKQSFDQMLLDLPPEVRGLFGALPGGALLQEYVDELAEKAGVQKSQTPAASMAIDDAEVSKAKILATALAEAQVQASAKMQSAAPMMAAAPAAGVMQPSGPTKIVLDKEFAATLAAGLAQALQKNEPAPQSGVKELAQTLGQTQLQIVKFLQNESAQQRAEMQNLFKSLRENEKEISAAQRETAPIAAAPASNETKELLQVLIESQQQLAKSLSEKNANQNTPPPSDNEGLRQLGQAITASQETFGKTLLALNERHKQDSMEIVKLISDSQQQMMNFMVQHNTLNQNASNAQAANNNNINISTADYSAQLGQIVEKLASIQPAAPVATTINFDSGKLGEMLKEVVQSQSELYRDMAKSQTAEISSIIALALKESQKTSTMSIIEALHSNPIIIQTDKTMPEAEAQPQEDEIDITEITAPKTRTEEPPHLQMALSDAEPEAEIIAEPLIEEPMEEETPEAEDVFEETPAESFLAEETPFKKKKKKKKKRNNDFLAETIATEPEIPVDAFDFSLEEDSAVVEPEAEPEIKGEAEADAEPMVIDDLIFDDEPEPYAAEENIGTNWLADISEETLPEEIVLAPLAAEEISSADDWGFNAEPEPEPVLAEILAETVEDDGEGSDWEWDYVEEEPQSEISFGNDNLQPLLLQNAIHSADLSAQDLSFEPVSISANMVSIPHHYHLMIADSAKAESDADPYQKSVIKP